MVLPLSDYIKPGRVIYVLIVIIYRARLGIYMLSILQYFEEDPVGDVSHPGTSSKHDVLMTGRS